MKLKNIGKSLLAMTLATTMALSAPMSVFANPSVVSAEDEEWQKLVREVEIAFKNSKGEVATEINKLNGTVEGTSLIEELYVFIAGDVPVLISEYELRLSSIKTAVNIIFGDEKLSATDLTSGYLLDSIEAKKADIKTKLHAHNLSVEGINNQLTTFNKVRKTAMELSYKLLKDDGFNLSLKVGEFNTFVGTLSGFNLTDKQRGILEIFGEEEIVKKYITKLNTIDGPIKKDIMTLLKDTYGLVEVVSKPPTSDITPGGGGGPAPSKDTGKEGVNDGLKDLSKKDANVADVTKEIAKNIEKLDAKTAKEFAAPVIKSMTDIIKKADTPAKVKEAQDAMASLVQGLVSRVTVQKVETKDGKATLSAAKIKEQMKDADEIIKQLTEEAEKNEIQLEKKIKATITFELDQEVADVAVDIPEGLRDAIDNKASVAIKAKGVEIELEHNTFAEKVYTINVKEKDGVIELTTSGTFSQPIAIKFAVDKKIANYPTVYQVLEDGNKLVGGTYDPATGMIKASLDHFSFYTVKESTPKAFTDISGLTWEKKAVNELSARGYLAGMTENTFVPNANTTRAEFAAMLTRVIPVAKIQGQLNFTDLKEDAWYYKSIETAVNQGWLVGRENNKFDPAAPVTRQEVASVLSRVLEQRGYVQTANLEEGVNVAAWAKDAVSLYLREVEVEEIAELDMSEAATRAELAVMIYEVLNK